MAALYSNAQSVGPVHSSELQQGVMEHVLHTGTHFESSAAQRQQIHCPIPPLSKTSTHTASSTSSEALRRNQVLDQEALVLEQSKDSSFANTVTKETTFFQTPDAIHRSSDGCLTTRQASVDQPSGAALAPTPTRPRRKLPARPPGAITLKTLVQSGVLQPGAKVKKAFENSNLKLMPYTPAFIA
jgi:hypothetical protein